MYTIFSITRFGENERMCINVLKFVKYDMKMFEDENILC